tara:strand:+ start:97905 stop:98354 length:450 start_codon:yes stop_codon:yes gene_type:complete
MKKLVILSIIFVAFFSCKNNKTTETDIIETNTKVQQVPDMHTSENTLDWHGTYQGILPCADCEGIQTEVTLLDNNTYTIKRIYLGKEETVFEETGDLQWTEGGSTVVLTNKKDGNATLFKVGENHLKQLDREGRAIEGELAEKYMLQKN